MRIKYFKFIAILLVAPLWARSAGINSQTLDTAIRESNEGTAGDFSLELTERVMLTDQVRALNTDGDFIYLGNTITVLGKGQTLDGQAQTRGFVAGGAASSAAGSVMLSDLIFENCFAQGGAGGNGGGGGLGAAGCLYVTQDVVVQAQRVQFINSAAFGGSSARSDTGEEPVSGGGGGMRGSSPSRGTDDPRTGGGGFGGNGDLAGGGSSGFAVGNASGTTPGANFNNDGTGGGPGFGGDFPGGTAGFGGGGGGSNVMGLPAGDGMFGGGGGGGVDAGGNGGFGGGGGASRVWPGASQSQGGFGAGSGSVPGFIEGGFGGGAGNSICGGRGAAFGGAIFLEPGAELTLIDPFFQNNVVIAGEQGNPNKEPIAKSGASGRDIFMMSGSILIFSTTDNLSLNFSIDSNQGNEFPLANGDTTVGGVTKTGSGKLGLVGENTFTGSLMIDQGLVQINGSVVANISINTGGRLQGNFAAKRDITGLNGGRVINNNELLIGETGKGKIAIDEEYVQDFNARLTTNITPGSEHGSIIVPLATLDGILNVQVDQGNYIAGTRYVIIDGNTGVTSFSSLTQSGTLAGEIQLGIETGSVVLVVLNNRIFQDQLINSGAAQDVATCFIAEQITPGTDFALITELLGTLSDSSVNKALISLSPARFGALEWINERNNSYVADILSQHLFELCCSPRDCSSCGCNTSAWLTVFGNLMDNTKWLDNLRPFDANAIGALVGIDYCCGPQIYYGLSVGYTHTHLIWKKQGGKGDLDSYYGALYGSWQCGCYSIDGSVIGGGTDQHLQRRIVFSTIDRVAKSDPWGYFFTAHLGAKADLQWGNATVEPFALGDYHFYTRQSFKEKEAGSLNLMVRSKDQHFIRAEAGLKTYSEWMAGCYCFAPYIGISWVGEFPLHASTQQASFIDRDCLMNVKSYDGSVQLAAPQAGFKWTCCNGVSLTLGYKGLFNNRTRINAVEWRLEGVF